MFVRDWEQNSWETALGIVDDVAEFGLSNLGPNLRLIVCGMANFWIVFLLCCVVVGGVGFVVGVVAGDVVGAVVGVVGVVVGVVGLDLLDHPTLDNPTSDRPKFHSFYLSSHNLLHSSSLVCLLVEIVSAVQCEFHTKCVWAPLGSF